MTFRKNFYLALIALLIFLNCSKKNDMVKADLSFRSINLTSAYAANKKQYDSLIIEIEKEFKNSKENNEFNKHLMKLHKNNVFNLPNIFLHFGSDSIMEVYVSEKEYKKVKDFRQVDLYKEKKKVTLELKVEKIDDNIYYSNNIISVKKVNGKSRSNVFKNED